jgi:hypothetical protein
MLGFAIARDSTYINYDRFFIAPVSRWTQYSHGLFVFSSGDKHWRPGRTIGETAGREIKGGDARTLARAFEKEEAIAQIEAILSKPIEDFGSIDRHEALAKALGIRPCWVVGINYLCFTGEDDFEAHYEGSREENDPTLEKAIALVRRTSIKSII